MEGKTPRISGPAERLRVYIGEADMHQGRGLWHTIILAAKRAGLAGATVHRAIEGFGASTRIHTASLLDLSADLPIVVEIVDSTEYIESFLPTLLDLVEHGMVTREPVQVVHYASGPTKHGPGSRTTGISNPLGQG
jgi:PII-like signaling protein